MKGFFVTGTDTGVGKTEVSVFLARLYSEKGLKVGVMKPVASGVNGVCMDADVLRKHTLLNGSIKDVNPVALKLALAPIVAARIENKKICLNTVWKSFERLKKQNDIMIVEGIGGLMVPICKIGRKVFYVLDMASKMKLPVIIVARPGLGTINHTIMTVRMLEARNIKIAGIIFNHASRIKNDLSVRTNPAVIEELSGVKVLGIMHYNSDRAKRRVRWLRKIGFWF